MGLLPLVCARGCEGKLRPVAILSTFESGVHAAFVASDWHAAIFEPEVFVVAASCFCLVREFHGLHSDFVVAPPCAGAAVDGGRRLLTRQARCRQRNCVRSSEDSWLSSLQFESLFVPHTRSFSLHPPLLGCAHGVDIMNSCGVMLRSGHIVSWRRVKNHLSFDGALVQFT